MGKTLDAPNAVCMGLTFLPVPEVTDVAVGFGAPETAFFKRRELPEVPSEFVAEVDRMFYRGGEYPQFGADVDVKKAKRLLRAWLGSWAPSHEAKVATVAYALWVWSPTAAQARATGAA